MNLYLKAIFVVSLSLVSFSVQAGVVATGIYESSESGEQVLLSHVALTDRTGKKLICQVNLHNHSVLRFKFEELSPVRIPFFQVNDCDNYQSMLLHGALMDRGLIEDEMQLASISTVQQVWVALVGLARTVSHFLGRRSSPVVARFFEKSNPSKLRYSVKQTLGSNSGFIEVQKLKLIVSGMYGCFIGSVRGELDFDIDDDNDFGQVMVDVARLSIAGIGWLQIAESNFTIALFGFSDFTCALLLHEDL